MYSIRAVDLRLSFPAPGALALALTCAALLALIPPAEAGRRGITGRQAPSWQGVRSWAQLPDGKTALDIADYKGKVVYLYFFQSWCPGCHSRGFPTLKRVAKTFATRDDVVFVAVQTVFEGFGTNTASRGLETVRGFGLDIPTGHDPGPDGRGSVLMKPYRSGGTPWTILIDREGVVRFDGFHLRPAEGISRVRSLL